jgi:dTMP kinase
VLPLGTAKSFYVIFEGIDGSGKSSQIKRLATFMKEALGPDREVLQLFEPTNGPYGQEIRKRAGQGPEMTVEEELDLFLRDRKEHVEKTLAPALLEGACILQDRSFYSTVAYQGSHEQSTRSLKELLALNDFAPRPDLVVLLDIPAELGLKRVKQRGKADAFEKLERQKRVRQNFLDMADDRFLVVDGTLGAEEISEVINHRVEDMLRIQS